MLNCSENALKVYVCCISIKIIFFTCIMLMINEVGRKEKF